MDTFWIVWSPQGHLPPTRRHDSYDDALTEAKRLANTAPGAEFFVCQALGVAKRREPVDYELLQEQPF